VLQSEGIESHVVDPASIATSRRRRRAKTDRIDGESRLRALLAFKRRNPGASLLRTRRRQLVERSGFVVVKRAARRAFAAWVGLP
jgi:transposase